MGGGYLGMRITSPKNNDTINPAPQINSMLACFVDLLLRIAVIWLSVLSLLLFVSDSFGFTVPLSFLALSAAFCVLFFAGMSAGIIPCLLGLILIGIVTYTTIRSINVLPVLEELWLTVQGVSVEKMLRLGYTLFENYEITSPPILYTKEQYEMTAFFILSFLLSGVFVPSMIRKVRLFPPFFVGFLICLPIFFLNLPDSNWGFALLICALCGILVIKRFETVYFKKNGLIRNKKPFYNSAFASFAGFAVTAIAILTIALPAAKIEEPAPTLDFIDRSVEKFRQRLDNLLSGQNEALPGVSPSLWAPRSTIAQNRKFSDDLVFTIKTFSDTPVYLRGWVGMNYTNDKWELPNQEFISEYKKLFGTSFIPDEITSNFYSFIGSTPAYISDSFIDLSDYGATMQQITISSRADTEYLHVPPVLYGRIFEPFDDYPLIDLQNHNFFDGILINPSKRNTPGLYRLFLCPDNEGSDLY